MFQVANTFVMWPLSMAAKVLSSQLKTAEDDPNGIVASLQLLHSTMEALGDPSGHWNNQIRDIGLQLAETGSVVKKRKQGKKSGGPSKKTP